VNFERMQLPPTSPVAKKDLPAFEVERDRWMVMLTRTGSNEVQAAAVVDSTKPNLGRWERAESLTAIC